MVDRRKGVADMFKVGDSIMYSSHGICRIDDICEKTYYGVTRTYYVLHPLEGNKLTISAPVDNDSVVMLKLIDRDETKEILESFKLPGIGWIEKNHLRIQTYSQVAKTGNRKIFLKSLILSCGRSMRKKGTIRN